MLPARFSRILAPSSAQGVYPLPAALHTTTSMRPPGNRPCRFPGGWPRRRRYGDCHGTFRRHSVARYACQREASVVVGSGPRGGEERGRADVGADCRERHAARERILLSALVVDGLEYYAGWPDKLVGNVNPVWPAPALDYDALEPHGVVVIIPWNSPLYSRVPS